MALHPMAQKVLDLQAATGVPPTWSMTPEEARKSAEVRRAVYAGEVVPVSSVSDQIIDGPYGKIPVRIYDPDPGAGLPVTVFFHGGGWVLGDLETHDDPCRRLANLAQTAIVSIDYQLSPEAKFPIAVEECYAGLAWAAGHGKERGWDPSRLAVAGISAGGNLAAAVALMARDRGGPPLRFQLLVVPVIDFDCSAESHNSNGEGFGLTSKDMRYYWEHYLAAPADADSPYACPSRDADLAGLPPALVITADKDPLRDEGKAYADQLVAAGVKTRYVNVPGMIHGFFGMAAAIDVSRDTIADAAGELQAALSE